MVIHYQIKAEGRDTRKWCHRRGLEEQRFFEMTKLKRQFQDILHVRQLYFISCPNDVSPC